MSSTGGGSEILEKISDLLAEEVGPVASLLAEESLAYWKQKLRGQNQKPGLRNIYIFINHLALSLDSEDAKKRFIDGVYEIESLQVLKNRST